LLVNDSGTSAPTDAFEDDARARPVCLAMIPSTPDARCADTVMSRG